MSTYIKGFEHLRVKLDVLTAATKDFAKDNHIGGGGFGPVYKGELVSSEHTKTVAIKRLDRSFGQGDPEFWKEVMMLSEYKHENIISLLGFCDEKGQKMLVYEHASRESLDKHLRNKELTWVMRLKICIGAARGLAYLHDPVGGHKRLLHRDIKSPNILLDESWNAKIADFGLSKIGPANQQNTMIFTNNNNVAGTLGYVDPQYMESGVLTKESDVYSFGVVLFEVLCGRLSIVKLLPHLIPLVREKFKEKKLNEIVWCNTNDEIHPASLKNFTTIAYQCLARKYMRRPLMKKIVRELESSLEYQSTADRKSSLVKECEHLRIGIESIKHATNNFGVRNFIAEGGSWKVYRGEFINSKKQSAVYAVKCLDCSEDDTDILLWKEIMLLRTYTHKNIVSLRGFCDDSEYKIIVYECEISEYLDSFLIDPRPTWIQRLNVCLEAACGLEYLHDDKGAQESVLHGDIKSCNILVGRKFNVYITNFGLHRYGRANKEHMLLFSDDKATLGCFDPVYKDTAILTKESDVYSFGLLLFEVLCYVDHNDERQRLPILVKTYQEQGIDTIIPAGVRVRIEQRCFDTFVTLAYQCLESDQSKRPSMNLVVSTLKTALEYQRNFIYGS